MYHLTPFRYLLEGMLALVTHGQPVVCTEKELAKFPAPPGETCESYASGYIQRAGGYITTLDNGLCGICQYANGDQFAASFNVYYSVSALLDNTVLDPDHLAARLERLRHLLGVLHL